MMDFLDFFQARGVPVCDKNPRCSIGAVPWGEQVSRCRDARSACAEYESFSPGILPITIWQEGFQRKTRRDWIFRMPPQLTVTFRDTADFFG
jgi:hypothetical protein